ncbi:ABC transporter substrate-binding protein [Aphanothece minutissima]|uniref:Branched-chain amino acid ABC transporter substrate-binding protein n=1 Tax=Aphanothece cf. minutissima CCALA 015 TaxID=2107695 RepID=A0ABX5F5A6_9CHRO|nr:ABC transporter substrate-binding protein [Aphanothece minutissima]PSB36556.1 branched-chain amino acid ABC transporter substrate-binding protein [Aphanothece cf. minutissima CCALA 015]
MRVGRLLQVGTGLLTLGLLVAGCSSDAGSQPVDLAGGVPVGAVLALTGNANVYGQDQKIGLELALQHRNGNGGINGQPLKLALEDSGSDEPGANAAFTLQINRGVLALVGPTLSQQAFSADPIAQRRGVPVVAPSNTATGIPEIGFFISRVSAQSSVIAPLAIERALKIQPGLKRAAVFYAQDDAYSTAETTIFQKALKEKGLDPVTVQRTQLNDQDFQNQISAALRERPDLIVLSLQAVDGGNLIRQLRELGYRGLIVAGNGMNTPNIYPICQKYCDGLLIAQAYSPELDTPANTAFLKAFQAAKGGAIPPQLTAQAYTALQVIGEALVRLDKRQPLKGATLTAARKALMEEILAGTYATPLGEIRFTPEGEVIQSQFFVAQVRMDPGGRSGRFALLK